MLNSFILEGILTVVVAVLSYMFVWDEPQSATFLSEHEKAVLLELLNDTGTTVSANPQLGHSHSFEWRHVKAAILDWQVSYTFQYIQNAITHIWRRRGFTVLVTGER
jgi:hypothetical protein